MPAENQWVGEVNAYGSPRTRTEQFLPVYRHLLLTER